jgi:hypothetical protein
MRLFFLYLIIRMVYAIISEVPARIEQPPQTEAHDENKH